MFIVGTGISTHYKRRRDEAVNCADKWVVPARTGPSSTGSWLPLLFLFPLFHLLFPVFFMILLLHLLLFTWSPLSFLSTPRLWGASSDPFRIPAALASICYPSRLFPFALIRSTETSAPRSSRPRVAGPQPDHSIAHHPPFYCLWGPSLEPLLFRHVLNSPFFLNILIHLLCFQPRDRPASFQPLFTLVFVFLRPLLLRNTSSTLDSCLCSLSSGM